MEINRSTILEIVRKCNIRPDKDYGQNFLLEPDICKKIVDALNVNEGENVLEIGPGLGSLTNHLIKTKANITAVDIDSKMIDFLKLSLHEATNLTLVNNDIRRMNVSTFDKVISNLPYNITSETILHILKNSKTIKEIVLMCQSETFSHFNDVSGKEYGPLSVLIHLVGECKRLFNVKAGSFYPVPKCQSTVFRISILNNANIDEALVVYKFTKQMFISRRKTILNNLTVYLNDKTLAASILIEGGVDLSLRPEQINPMKYKEIYSLLTKNVYL